MASSLIIIRIVYSTAAGRETSSTLILDLCMRLNKLSKVIYSKSLGEEACWLFKKECV
jgi:hypothetical protein